MADGNFSPADIAAMSGDMGGNNAFFWIFALLLLGGMGGNGWGNNGYRPQYATQDFVQNGPERFRSDAIYGNYADQQYDQDHEG